MRTTVTLNETLLERAKSLTGITTRSDLLDAALSALIARESAKRLSLLGGTDPTAKVAERRRA